MSTLPPTNLAYEDVAAALATLGIGTKDLREVVIEPRQITARYIRRTVDGHAIAAGDQIAEVTYDIGIIR